MNQHTLIHPYLEIHLYIQVNVKEAVDLRDAIILSGGDLRQPQNLTTKMKAVTRDKEVNKSLFQMLSLKPVVRTTVKCTVKCTVKYTSCCKGYWASLALLILSFYLPTNFHPCGHEYVHQLYTSIPS